jgi:hypothetical protein
MQCSTLSITKRLTLSTRSCYAANKLWKRSRKTARKLTKG